MSVQNRLISLKQLISIVGIAGTSVLLSLPALAQSSVNSAPANSLLAQASEEGTDDFELSPEGFEILCERFPLNSRCEGTTSSDSGAEGTAQDPNTDVTDPAIEPGNAPSDDSDGGTQDDSVPGGSGIPSDDSSDTVPGSPSDSDTDVSDPAFEPGNAPSDDSDGGTQDSPGEMMSPPSGSPGGGTMSPPTDSRPPAAEPDGSTTPPPNNQ